MASRVGRFNSLFVSSELCRVCLDAGVSRTDATRRKAFAACLPYVELQEVYFLRRMPEAEDDVSKKGCRFGAPVFERGSRELFQAVAGGVLA